MTVPTNPWDALTAALANLAAAVVVEVSRWLPGDLWPGETDPEDYEHRLRWMAGA